MTQAQQIAEQLLGPITWLGETHGQCDCPGADKHTKETKPTDCEVYVDECSHIHCFHSSCEEDRELASFRLRELLEEAGVKQSGRPSQRREKRAKVRFEPERLAELELRGMSREWVARRSPVGNPELITSRGVLSMLYDETEDRVLIFVGDNENQGHTMWPSQGRTFVTSHAHGVWFLPQPVSGRWIDNPRTGRKSRRSHECVTEFRWLVAESDEADENQWLSYLVQLEAPIAAIYTSGGRSIHALIHVGAHSREEWDRKTADLREDLVIHGADPQSLTSVRLSRLPNAYRGGEQQRLLYLDPNPPARPIYASQTT